MSFEKPEKSSGTRHKAREAALQMLFAADVAKTAPDDLCNNYWGTLGEDGLDAATRDFADSLAKGTLEKIEVVDERIKHRAEHWRIERMACVDRNILRLAIYELLYRDTPATVIINEGLELARCFSTFESTQFINGILDAIKHDLENDASTADDAIKTKATTK
ncbi:MAG: transcription antitermination factor NusB [Acidobacteriota bacterium]|nr:MAG: transcription antitermination factor NusB [Acidobacteriota bacterium]